MRHNCCWLQSLSVCLNKAEVVARSPCELTKKVGKLHKNFLVLSPQYRPILPSNQYFLQVVPPTATEVACTLYKSGERSNFTKNISPTVK